MKISINTMQKLSKIKNSVYDDIKIEYLSHVHNTIVIQRSYMCQSLRVEKS